MAKRSMGSAALLSQNPPGKTDNLADMSDLDESIILRELKLRAESQIMYTYVGDILVSMNSFEWIDGLYSPEKMTAYRSMGDKAILPPHVFASADGAYAQMCNSKKNQVCVISGESGAGKTEAAKLFVKQLVNVSNGAEFEGLEEKLLEVNPVLESFGNAKTQYNNNSSRFGKFTSVKFNTKGQVKGAEMLEYLLEKSRVVGQSENEQNFHIFYLMAQGKGGNPTLAVGDPGDHRYINGNDAAIANIKAGPDAGGFAISVKELDDCLKTLGFDEQTQMNMYAILSGILHLGNLEFEGEDEATICSDAGVLGNICTQLGLDQEQLNLAMTQTVSVIAGEEVVRKLNLEAAEDVRDATSKAIYSTLFSWIVKKCNEQLAKGGTAKLPDDTSMGILDIFGFENFARNSLEQLCINLTNEQLQWYFNEFIFAQELKEYASEGINGKDITYEKNEPLLDMLLRAKPLGLLGIVNEQCGMGKATDSTMIQKCHETFKGDTKEYHRPKGNDNKFTLTHYAGDVEYDGDGFLEKNRDTLQLDVVATLRISKNELLEDLYQGDKKGAKGGGIAGHKKSMKHARAAATKKGKKTVCYTFKSQLLDLKAELLAASPHFIRCIKANHQKVAKIFDEDLVKKQLAYCGMLETTRIRREGFASRPTFVDFVQRYKMLGFAGSSDVPASVDSCKQILALAGCEGYEVGKTKVFLRYFHQDELNGKIEPFVAAAIDINQYSRGFAARAIYAEKLAAKRAQDTAAAEFIAEAEKFMDDCANRMAGNLEVDAARPTEGPGSLGYVTPPPEPEPEPEPVAAEAEPPAPPPPPAGGGGGKRAKNKKKMNRSASVKWYQEGEAKKGAGKKEDGEFADWFHGIISRTEAEALLVGQKDNTFLIRVAETRFGYSLSLIHGGVAKHFMIDQQEEDNLYIVVGNERTFPSLNQIVTFHGEADGNGEPVNPVTDDQDGTIHPCPGTHERTDLAELAEAVE